MKMKLKIMREKDGKKDDFIINVWIQHKITYRG